MSLTDKRISNDVINTFNLLDPKEEKYNVINENSGTVILDLDYIRNKLEQKNGSNKIDLIIIPLHWGSDVDYKNFGNFMGIQASKNYSKNGFEGKVMLALYDSYSYFLERDIRKIFNLYEESDIKLMSESPFVNLYSFQDSLDIKQKRLLNSLEGVLLKN
jgi:hypothetical protein